MKIYQQKKLVIGTLSLCFFVILACLVSSHVQWFYNLDSLIYLIEWDPNKWVVQFVSLIAKTATIGPIFAVSVIFSWLLWRSSNKILACWVSGNVLAVSALGYISKSLIARSRPNVGQLTEKTSYSFPSGHSLLAMCLACSVIIALSQVHKSNKRNKKNRRNKKEFINRKKENSTLIQKSVRDQFLIKNVLIGYVIVIGLSRIFLRVHYPSDVLAGYLLSLCWVNLSFVLLEKTVLNGEENGHRNGSAVIKRTILSVLVVILVMVTSASAYAINVYNHVQKTADKMYQPLDRETQTVELASHEPVSFLLLGIANDSKRKTDYRANTVMVVTVNNQKEKTTMTSLPRDAYVEIVGEDNLYDKLNHAHSFGGEEMIMDTVENFLEIPIHHYFVINMDGLVSLSDAVGGVTVNNDFEFDAEGIHYPQGEQHLNGWETLQYSRMRYEDPLGDYGRQARQREVTIQLMNELMSIKNVFRYQELLDIIGENGQTDITLNEMVLLLKNYQKALENVDSFQMQGEGFEGDGIIGEEGISYQSISEAERQKIMRQLKEQLEIDTTDDEITESSE